MQPEYCHERGNNEIIEKLNKCKHKLIRLVWGVCFVQLASKVNLCRNKQKTQVKKSLGFLILLVLKYILCSQNSGKIPQVKKYLVRNLKPLPAYFKQLKIV